MSNQGYDKVLAAMKDQPKIDLPSYEDLAMTAVDVAHMHLRRDLLRGGFYCCDVCLQRAPRESQINHLATCTAGRILAWSRGGLLAVEESAEDERLRENAKELLERACEVLCQDDEARLRVGLANLDTVVTKITCGD